MNDNELDTMLSARFKAYVEKTHLPNGFKERFVGAVKRTRAWRRMGLLALAGVLAMACVAMIGFGRRETGCGGSQPRFVATTPRTNDAMKASCWMILGYLQECFKRNKGNRRKEEED